MAMLELQRAVLQTQLRLDLFSGSLDPLPDCRGYRSAIEFITNQRHPRSIGSQNRRLPESKKEPRGSTSRSGKAHWLQRNISPIARALVSTSVVSHGYSADVQRGGTLKCVSNEQSSLPLFIHDKIDWAILSVVFKELRVRPGEDVRKAIKIFESPIDIRIRRCLRRFESTCFNEFSPIVRGPREQKSFVQVGKPTP